MVCRTVRVLPPGRYWAASSLEALDFGFDLVKFEWAFESSEARKVWDGSGWEISIDPISSDAHVNAYTEPITSLMRQMKAVRTGVMSKVKN